MYIYAKYISYLYLVFQYNALATTQYNTISGCKNLLWCAFVRFLDGVLLVCFYYSGLLYRFSFTRFIRTLYLHSTMFCLDSSEFEHDCACANPSSTFLLRYAFFILYKKKTIFSFSQFGFCSTFCLCTLRFSLDFVFLTLFLAPYTSFVRQPRPFSSSLSSSLCVWYTWCGCFYFNSSLGRFLFYFCFVTCCVYVF